MQLVCGAPFIPVAKDYIRNKRLDVQDRFPTVYDNGCLIIQITFLTLPVFVMLSAIFVIDKLEDRFTGDKHDINMSTILELLIFDVLCATYSIVCRKRNDRHLVNLSRRESDHKSVMLICKAKEEGILGIELPDSLIKAVKSLSETHRIIFKKTGTVAEINDLIDIEVSKEHQVNTLMIIGHGNPEELRLGRQTLSSIDIDELHLSRLAANADIILDSCESGKPNEGRLNFAEHLQFIAGRSRKIYAATDCVTNAKTYRLEDGKIRPDFAKVSSTSLFSTESVPTAKISYDQVVEKMKKLSSFTSTSSISRMSGCRIHQYIENSGII